MLSIEMEEMSHGSAQVGIQVESLQSLEGKTAAEGTAASQQSTLMEMAWKIARWVVHHAESFSVSVPNGEGRSVEVVPLSAIHHWINTPPSICGVILEETERDGIKRKHRERRGIDGQRGKERVEKRREEDSEGVSPLPMNFFKRKFSFTDEDDTGEISLDEVASSPPSSFSLSKMAERVSSTISAPTSPVRSSDTLVRALERSLQPSTIQPPQLYAPDAKTILIIDDHLIDWSKYFRSTGVSRIRVEQANFSDVHLQCTEHTCIVEIKLREGESKHINIDSFLIGNDAASLPCSDRIIRSIVTANIPSINSHSATLSFLSFFDLKKQLRRFKLRDGSSIPFLPSIHYPSFHKFNPTNHFPIVISIGNGRNGQGKIKVNTSEELSDLEGIIYKTHANEEVEVEPFVDIKYDIHVQKVGREIKSFVRRGISAHWKSNAASAVLEQVKTNERHVEYIDAISNYLGGCGILSIDILVAKDGREFVHSCHDRLRYFGESQEEDRRSMCILIHDLLFPPHNTLNGQRDHHPPKREIVHDNEEKKEDKSAWHPTLPSNQLISNGKDANSGEDTMGQLKRTFAGIFGDLSIS